MNIKVKTLYSSFGAKYSSNDYLTHNKPHYIVGPALVYTRYIFIYACKRMVI